MTKRKAKANIYEELGDKDESAGTSALNSFAETPLPDCSVISLGHW